MVSDNLFNSFNIKRMITSLAHCNMDLHLLSQLLPYIAVNANHSLKHKA